MNKTDELAHQLNEMLLSSEESLTYQKSLRSLKAHPEIFELEKELKHLQQKLLKMRTSRQNDTSEWMAIYKDKREAFETHPLVVNYLYDQACLNALAQWVREAIQGQLED